MDVPPQKTLALPASRQCPSPQGNDEPLIEQTIGVAACLARQRQFYHKCHRCRYRGQAASFVLPDRPASGERKA